LAAQLRKGRRNDHYWEVRKRKVALGVIQQFDFKECAVTGGVENSGRRSKGENEDRVNAAADFVSQRKVQNAWGRPDKYFQKGEQIGE